jgi:PucR family transcriptional regulator, purine catabolism regulatory protein
MLPSVAQVLALDPVRAGAPQVVAGADRLATPVRWVHVIELAQAAHLLRGGELVLSTGIALPADDAGLARYAADLAAVGVSALAVELGSRYATSLPAALVRAAAEHGLPLIMLERETRFIEITEAVHALILDAQLAELRSAERLHQVFTDLAVSGASADDVVAQTDRLAGCPAILENLAHQVLSCAPGTHDAAALLAGFPARSRAVHARGRTGYDAATGWLVTVVGARGEDWGRLVLLRGRPGPAPGDLALIERAATTLALVRLLDSRRDSLERQAHAAALATFLGRRQAGTGPGQAGLAEAEARARALGVPVTGRQLVAVVVRLDPSSSAVAGGRPRAPGLAAQARTTEVAEALADACRLQDLPALVGPLADNSIAVLLALPPRADPDAALARLAAELGPRLSDGDVIAAGSAADSVSGGQRSLVEAGHVAAAAPGPAPGRPVYRLADLRLRGLLHQLRDDPRVQSFAERELGPLLAHDDADGGKLLAALGAYLSAGGNKAAAARRARLARPTLYERLRQIEHVLGVDLDAAESRLSLHVALLALGASGREH